MDQGSAASVALLMLDIASAKSSLTQLAAHCTAASEEHKRTRGLLQDLRQEVDDSSLYALHGLRSSKSSSSSQQLQALHSENLALKALLKSEVEARQQLESQHAALVELLRSIGLHDLLATAQASHQPSSPDRSSAASQQHGCCPSPPAAAGTAPAARDVAAAGGTGRSPMAQSQDCPTERESDGAAAHSSTECAPGPSSAYFPAAAATAGFPQQQRQQQDSNQQQQQWCADKQQRQQQASRQRPTAFQDISNHQQACADKQQPAAAPRSQAKPHTVDTWQAALLQNQHCRRLRAQLSAADPAQQPPPSAQQHDLGCTDWSVPVGTAAATSSEASVSLSSSPPRSGASSSAGSDLLDSEDLQELAGLCDGLVTRRHHQAQQQQQQQARPHQQQQVPALSGGEAGAARAGSSSSSSLGLGPFADLARSRQQQGAAAKNAGAQQQQQQQQQQEGEVEPHADLGRLAAQLERLQQLACPAGAWAAQQPPPPLQQQAPAATLTPTRQVGSSQQAWVGECEAGSGAAGLHASHFVGAEPGLQEQLRQRMQEVKQRLSSICSGMLQQAMDGPTTAAEAAAGGGPSCRRGGSPGCDTERPAAAENCSWNKGAAAAGGGGAGECLRQGASSSRAAAAPAASTSPGRDNIAGRFAGSGMSHSFFGAAAPAAKASRPHGSSVGLLAAHARLAAAAAAGSAAGLAAGASAAAAAVGRPVGCVRPRVGPGAPAMAQAPSAAPCAPAAPAGGDGSGGTSDDDSSDDGSWSTVDEEQEQESCLQGCAEACQRARVGTSY